mgnify:FL=1
MGLTLTSQIKTVLQRVKTYSVGHIAELAQTVSNLLEEVDKVKADKPEYIDIIIPATGWQTDSTVTGYTHYLDIPVEGLTADDKVDVRVAPASKAVADAARFTTTESLAGVLRLRAANVPSAAITAQYDVSAAYIAPAEETEET